MERIVEDPVKNKKKEQKSKGGNADWSAFISDIKALSELLILLVAAMRYLEFVCFYAISATLWLKAIHAELFNFNFLGLPV